MEEITSEIRTAYMENVLLDAIRKISDINFQQKVWVEASIPHIVDTWEETMCQFFDDANIDDFLADLDPKFGFSEGQIEELWKLRNKLDDYCNVTPKYMNPRDVLSDPRWHEVVACAKETLKAFEGYQVPPDPQFDS